MCGHDRVRRSGLEGDGLCRFPLSQDSSDAEGWR